MKTLKLFFLLLVLGMPAMAQDDQDGVAIVPLREYLELALRIEEIQAQASQPREASRAELVAERAVVRWGDGVARVTTVFEIEASGTPTAPVALPVTGFARSATVEPRRGATLHRLQDGIVLVVSEPGSYTVSVESSARLEETAGEARLRLAPASAPVASVDVELAEDLEWEVEGATVVTDEIDAGRRRVRLAPELHKAAVVTVRRRAAGAEQQRLLARASVVTVVEATAAQLRRHDVVGYQVQRGELAGFDLELPESLELAGVASDEGEAPGVVDGRRLHVERRQRLAGAGFVAVSYRPLPLGEHYELETLHPRVQVDERFLVVAQAAAAVVRPAPENAWRRVDTTDLPSELSPAIAALRPNAVYRLADPDALTSLQVRPLPAATTVAGVVWRRRTTTLLTVDGSLVHRDRLNVRGAGTALGVALPAGATLWSAEVDGVAVRPLESGGRFLVPLAFRTGGESVVEVVAVEERAIEPRRSRIRLLAPRYEVPVLEHDWRLLLPERNSYRFADGDLRPAPPPPPPPPPALPPPPPPSAAPPPPPPCPPFPAEQGPNAYLTGTVSDETGTFLPGVTIHLSGTTESVTVSDTCGRFLFRDLEPGLMDLRAELEGFATVEHTITISANRRVDVELQLPLATVEEVMVVTNESPLLDQRKAFDTVAQHELEKIPSSRELGTFKDLVGGVKPLSVEIPESGKLLRLTGVLPPAEVAVELEVKARRP